MMMTVMQADASLVRPRLGSWTARAVNAIDAFLTEDRELGVRTPLSMMEWAVLLLLTAAPAVMLIA